MRRRRGAGGGNVEDRRGMPGGRISPESFTHGTSEQRASWFKRGFDGGDASACDTFSGDI